MIHAPQRAAKAEPHDTPKREHIEADSDASGRWRPYESIPS